MLHDKKNANFCAKIDQTAEALVYKIIKSKKHKFNCQDESRKRV